MAPTHSVELSSENSVTAKRYHQKWTSDLQVESYDPVSVKWFGFVSLDDVQPQDKQYVSRLVVGRTQLGKLSLKTLNYWMSSV